eukprot:TRINITY_DN72559_c0_g3_i1.p1 TRINITY_DN72559_c0_g3~~TRINITY_DN72559_c0_g3_i1.p1  ORF type:complete len:371 (-),score=30.85 TRINITY_DN72559_c0_g3_i1:144-1256(-)
MVKFHSQDKKQARKNKSASLTAFLVRQNDFNITIQAFQQCFNQKIGTKVIIQVLQAVRESQQLHSKLSFMKNYKLSTFLVALLTLAGWGALQAQYDDLYFDPDTDYEYNDSDYAADSYQDDYEYEYDDDEYEFDDYDYQYSSRIRRFHRNYYGFNYYDPVYVDVAYYDPFFRPGISTVLIYDDFYSYNSFRRWNRWNRINRWNRFGAWDPFYSPFAARRAAWGGFGPAWGGGFNTWGGGFGPAWGGGFNSWGGGFGGGFANAAFGSGYYCPPSWGNNFTYNTVNVNNNATRVNPAPRVGSRNVATTPRTNGRSWNTTNTNSGTSSRNGRSYNNARNSNLEVRDVRRNTASNSRNATRGRNATRSTDARPN